MALYVGMHRNSYLGTYSCRVGSNARGTYEYIYMRTWQLALIYPRGAACAGLTWLTGLRHPSRPSAEPEAGRAAAGTWDRGLTGLPRSWLLRTACGDRSALTTLSRFNHLSGYWDMYQYILHLQYSYHKPVAVQLYGFPQFRRVSVELTANRR